MAYSALSIIISGLALPSPRAWIYFPAEPHLEGRRQLEQGLSVAKYDDVAEH